MSEDPETPQDIARYLSKAFATGDPRLVGGALGVVVRKKGVSTVARLARTRREPIYRTLSGEFSSRPCDGHETAGGAGNGTRRPTALASEDEEGAHPGEDRSGAS